MNVRTVAIIGAGTMGAGIAQVCAQTGWDTRIYDAFPEGLQKGMDSIQAFWDKGIARGKTSEQQKSEWSANLSVCEDIAEAVTGADLVIEAVPEVMDLKQGLFRELETLAPEVLVASTA